MSLPTPNAATQQEVRRLLKRLARLKNNWPQELALRDLSPQMVEALLNHSAKQNRATRQCLYVAVSPLMIMAFAQALMPLRHAIAIESILMVCGLILLIPMSRKRINAVYALTMTSDLRILPTFIQATDYKGGEHPDIVAAITRLLPQVTEDDAGLLDGKAQGRLWRLAIASLNYKRQCNEALADGAISALTHIGNRDTLNRMRHFTLHMTFYPSHRRVYDAMRQAIPLIEARLKRQEVPETLLRAAALPASTSNTLLRSARATRTEPPEQLLRAGASETAEAEL